MYIQRNKVSRSRNLYTSLDILTDQSVKPFYSGIAIDRQFFRYRKIPFNRTTCSLLPPGLDLATSIHFRRPIHRRRWCLTKVSILTSLYNFSISTFVLIPYRLHFNPYPTAFPYGNGMVLHFYQQQESSTTKTVHKVINKGLKATIHPF